MKKLFEKIVSIATAIIGTLFMILLLVVMFQGMDIRQMDNQLVHALMITLAIVFTVLLGLSIYAAFLDTDKLSSIILFKDKESATKASMSVVKSTAKKAAKAVEGAKLTKVRLIADENGNVRLKVDLKVTTENVDDTVINVRAQVEDAFEKIYGVKFHYIDINLVKVKNNFKSDQKDIDAKVAQLKDKISANEPMVDGVSRASFEVNAQPENTENAAEEVPETDAPAEEAAGESPAEEAVTEEVAEKSEEETENAAVDTEAEQEQTSEDEEIEAETNEPTEI